VTVSGSGFAASVSGVVWFDSNNNGVLDPGEPNAPVITDAFGAFSVTLVVPDVPAGTYNIYADVPLGSPVEASASFIVPTPSITISPTSGPPGTSITVVGSNFKLGATVTIFFDVDGDGVVDPGETVGTATASSTGAFSTVVPAPTLPFGTYDVRATDGVNTAPAVTFTITPAISLSPTSGSPGTTVTVSGSGFAAGASGIVWFDIDDDNVVDAGEPSVAVTASATGTFTATLTVPTVAAGTYNIKADVPSGGPVEASATFIVPTPSITISPTSGPPGTSITVTGSGFNVGASGFVWFDIDGDGVLDLGEPSVSVTASATGTFTATLTVPTVPFQAAGYNIRADVPSGGPVEASATFLVTPAISLSPTSGPPGTTVTVSGSGFAASVSGVVWFDSNNNGALDSGEPSASVTTGPLGTFTATLTVPTVAAGTYNIRADVPSGGPVEASATFTVLIPSITVSPTSGPPGTSVSISGTDFIPGASGFVWFDIDGDGVLDPGEPSVSVTASATGTFTATLTVPTVPFQAAGYNIRADVPSGGPVEASATFLVTPAISLSPTSGSPGTIVTVSGSGFAAGASGVVWFDIDDDNVVDAGEPSVAVTASATGTFTATLTVPTVAAGTYNIKADVPLGLPVEAFATFTVLIPSITVSPTTVSSGQLITIAGTDFTPGASGVVWFDIDGDSVPDPGEPQVTVTVSSGGTFITTLTTPDVPAGTYNIRADIPPGPPLEASAPIVVAAPGFAALMAAIQDIEAKLDPGGAFYTFVNNWFTTINNKLGTFGLGESVKSLLDDIKETLGTFGPGESVKSLLDDIKETLGTFGPGESVKSLLGTFNPGESVASLLYQIRTAVTALETAVTALDLTPVRAGDVVSSKAGTNIAVTSASPYVIGGFPANKAFRGTLTIEIDTTLGSGVFLAVEVWDGDSWARVWRSASNAPAGTAVSIDIAGLTDGTGNAVRIVTNAATSRQFDYVFVYHIDLG
jgi:hypothetical protein